MKCNVKLHPNYFSVKVSVVAVIFRQQIFKNQQFQAKLSVFFKFVNEIHKLVQKR